MAEEIEGKGGVCNLLNKCLFCLRMKFPLDFTLLKFYVFYLTRNGIFCPRWCRAESAEFWHFYREFGSFFGSYRNKLLSKIAKCKQIKEKQLLKFCSVNIKLECLAKCSCCRRKLKVTHPPKIG